MRAQQARSLSQLFKSPFDKRTMCALFWIFTCLGTRYLIKSLAQSWLDTEDGKSLTNWTWILCKKSNFIWPTACRVQGQQNWNDYWHFCLWLMCQDLIRHYTFSQGADVTSNWKCELLFHHFICVSEMETSIFYSVRDLTIKMLKR